MAAEVGALRVAIGADITGLTEGMAKAQSAVSGGVAVMSKSAKASAKVFEDSRKSADQLLSSIDPLYGAQVRYDKELARAQELMKAGSLTAAEFAKVQGGLKSQLDAAAGGFEGIHKGAGNSRLAMLEMQHVARGAADQFAAGAPLSMIFSQHLAQVAQAATFAEGSMGKFGTFLGGPWGIALTLATVVLAKLAFGHKDAQKSVEDLLDKMHKQADETALQETANKAWAQSLDGVREAQEKLRKELEGSLKTEGLVRQQNLASASEGLQQQQDALSKAQQREADLERQLRAPAGPSIATPGGTGVSGEESRIAGLKKQLADVKKDIATLQGDIKNSQATIRDAQLTIADASADASASAAAAVTHQSEALKGLVDQAVVAGKVSVDASEKARLALNKFSEAQQAAAGQTVNFKSSSLEVQKLTNEWISGRIGVVAYAKAVDQATTALNKAAEAAKAANKNKLDPASQFKQAVIGAEGTGQNAESSASGFGQFIKSTWISYFDRLFPDKASLTDDAKLAFRNVRSVAEAVIDKATDDYSKVLKNAGQQITAANLYIVHMLSAGDPKGRVALRLLTAPSDASARSIVGANVAAKNGNIFTGTAGEARAEVARRIGDSSSAVSSGAAAIDQALQKGLEDEAKKRQRFFDDEQQTFGQIIEARKEQGLSAADIAEVEHDAVEQSRQKLEVDIKGKQAAGEYTKDEAQLRLQLNDQLAHLRNQAIDRVQAEKEYAERERQIENDTRVVTGLATAQSDLLKAREGLVTTAQGRRVIEERLLELQYDEEKRQLTAQIEEAKRLRALADRTKATQDIAAAERAEADAKVAQAKLSTLPERREIALRQNDRANASPLQQWAADVPKTADEINAALQSIEVKGLDGLTDAISGVIEGTQSLKSAFHDLAASILADLIKMTIKMMIFRAISAVGGMFGGGGGGIGTDVGASIGAGSPLGGFDGLGGFATGGGFTILGNTGIDKNVMSLNGIPIAKVSHGERVNIANDDMPMDGGHRPIVLQTFDLHGAVVTEDLLRQMDEKSAAAAQAGAKMGVDLMMDQNTRTFGRALGRR